MRTRDQAKYDSIVEATITLTNKLGIDGISISKIAKKAKVSPATIYIYFENKEDLFTKLYVDIRRKMSQGALEGLEKGMTIEEHEEVVDQICCNKESHIGGIHEREVVPDGFSIEPELSVINCTSKT